MAKYTRRHFEAFAEIFGKCKSKKCIVDETKMEFRRGNTRFDEGRFDAKVDKWKIKWKGLMR